MQKRYNTDCTNCKKVLPFTVVIDERISPDDPKAITQKQLTCPFCQTSLTVDLQQPLKMDDTVLRSSKKE